MNGQLLPFLPISGLSPVLFVTISVLIGVAFGFFLERAGFGSAKNLTSIFILRDFRVFRVMFSAVVTAMLGTQILRHLGLLNMNLVAFDPTFFWAMLAGGLLFGVGFYVGGFCPGTAIVALARGRWDGPAFLIGIVLGIYGFALMYDAIGTAPWFVSFYAPTDATRQTLYGEGQSWPWVVGLTVVALVAFKVVPIVERRFALKTVEQLEAAKAGTTAPASEPPVLSGRLLKVGAPLAGVAALAIVVLELTRPLPELNDSAPRAAAVAVDHEEAPIVDPLTVAGWVLSEAHRRAAKTPVAAYFVDLRSDENGGTIPGSERVDLEGSTGDEALANLVERLPSVAPDATKGLPVVLIGADGVDVAPLAAGLRKRGVNAAVLEGGFENWSKTVLSSGAPLPMPTIRLARAAKALEPSTADAATGGELTVSHASVAPTVDMTPETEAAPQQETVPNVESAQGTVAATNPPASETPSGDHNSGNGADDNSRETSLPEVDLAVLQQEFRDWFTGRREELPPRFAFPGSVPPTTKAVTVKARGGAGGGCG